MIDVSIINCNKIVCVATKEQFLEDLCIKLFSLTRGSEGCVDEENLLPETSSFSNASSRLFIHTSSTNLPVH